MALIRNPKDFWAGVLFVAFGTAAIVIAPSYPLGTAARMGPGYFPRMLGILLIVLGVDPRRCARSSSAGRRSQMRNLKPLVDRAGQRRASSA